MNFTKLMLSILVFVFMLSLGLMVFSDMNEEYSLGTNSTDIIDANVQKQINDTFDILESQKSAMLNQTIESGEEGWYSMIRGVYTAIKTPFTVAGNMFEVAGALGNSMMRQLGIPKIVFDVLIIALGFVVIGMILHYVKGFEAK